MKVSYPTIPLTLFGVLLLSCVVSTGTKAQSIAVVTATYGGNCGAPGGNMTAALGAACNGKATCEYKIDHAVIGDPKPGCAKNYVAQWRCPDLRNATTAPEASGKAITLSCQGPASRVSEGVHSPERVLNEIEGRAKRREGKSLPRYVYFLMMHAANATEFGALGRYSVMLLTIHSQKSEELPPRRVYVRANERDTLVDKISGWRSDVDSKLLAYKIYGRYREDGFYLLPTGMLVKPGEVYIDFAPDGLVMDFLRLPTASAPWINKNLPDLNEPPRAKPDLKALQSLIQRKFPGFPVPTSLP